MYPGGTGKGWSRVSPVVSHRHLQESKTGRGQRVSVLAAFANENGRRIHGSRHISVHSRPGTLESASPAARWQRQGTRSSGRCRPRWTGSRCTSRPRCWSSWAASAPPAPGASSASTGRAPRARRCRPWRRRRSTTRPALTPGSLRCPPARPRSRSRLGPSRCSVRQPGANSAAQLYPDARCHGGCLPSAQPPTPARSLAAGAVRFLEGYYLLFITRLEPIGIIAGARAGGAGVGCGVGWGGGRGMGEGEDWQGGGRGVRSRKGVEKRGAWGSPRG